MKRIRYGMIVALLILYGFAMFKLGHWSGWRANEETLVNGWVRFYGNEASQLDYWKLRAKKEGLE